MQDLHSSTLFDDPGGKPAETLSKKGFAEVIGVSAGRVSQLIAAGLPVEPNGRIHVGRGKAWVAQNVDPNRRRASLDPSPLPVALTTPRAVRDAAEAEIARLKAERLGGALIDRAAALRVIEGRARFERDAWIGWVNRAAPEIAAETGGGLAGLVALLDRLVRAQLATLADRRLEEIEREETGREGYGDD